MTDPYARPADQPAGDDNDLTVPLVPESGYAQPAQPPYSEETLVDPLAASPWARTPAQDFGYTPTPGRGTAPGSESGGSGFQTPPAGQGYPSAADYWRGVNAGAAQPGAAPAPTAPAQSNYTQPQVGYSQPQPGYGASGYPQPQYPGSGLAEPANPAALAQYQPYPPAGQPQPPQWPAVIPDPGAHDYGYSPNLAPSEHPNAIPALVLGIIGLVLFPLVAPVAWYLGAKGQREMRYDPGRWRPSGSLTAGKVLGIIGTSFMALGILIIMFFIFMILAAG